MQTFLFGAGAVLVGVPSIAALLDLFDAGYKVQRGGDLVEAFVLSVLIAAFILVVATLPGAKDVYFRVREQVVHAASAIRRMLKAAFRKVRA